MSVTTLSVLVGVLTLAADDGHTLTVTNGVIASSRGFITKDDVKVACRSTARAAGHRLGLFTRDGDVFTAQCLDCERTISGNRKPNLAAGEAHVSGNACVEECPAVAERAAKKEAAEKVKAEREADRAAKRAEKAKAKRAAARKRAAKEKAKAEKAAKAAAKPATGKAAAKPANKGAAKGKSGRKPSAGAKAAAKAKAENTAGL